MFRYVSSFEMYSESIKRIKKILFLARLEFGWNYIQTKNPKTL